MQFQCLICALSCNCASIFRIISFLWFLRSAATYLAPRHAAKIPRSLKGLTGDRWLGEKRIKPAVFDVTSLICAFALSIITFLCYHQRLPLFSCIFKLRRSIFRFFPFVNSRQASWRGGLAHELSSTINGSWGEPAGIYLAGFGEKVTHWAPVVSSTSSAGMRALLKSMALHP